ncbi:MAG TPA: hypothetical protein VM600_03135, partial [Actinomycetota bacterium]|nr:hypothetical protein [Actinomycetota bacterium]
LRVVSVLCLALAMLPARAETHELRFACDGRDGAIEAMENEYIVQTGYGDCWFHVGHHTYDMGRPYRLGRLAGSIVSVEVVFSPTVEFAPSTQVPLEGSIDGRTWTTLHKISYRDRRAVEFSLDADGAVARFLRIRQPRSLARGLSGFLDSSGFTAVVEEVDAAVIAPRTELSCSDGILERFFDEHPCWFGGINRYDSPSVFHTYAVGTQTVSRVKATATYAPWRTDDYFSNGGSRTDVTGILQASADGTNWTKLAEARGSYGSPITLDSGPMEPVEISFVRLVAEYHKGVRADPAWKHARGMLVDSSVRLSG